MQKIWQLNENVEIIIFFQKTWKKNEIKDQALDISSKINLEFLISK